MKKSSFHILTILFFLTTIHLVNGQIPDDINGRLYRLAKVWGLAKYFHPESCLTDPNQIIEEAIDSVLVSTSNQAFNTAVMKMLQTLGDVPTAGGPLVITSDINKNAHFEWKEDPLFSPQVHDFLDDIIDNFRPVPNCLVIQNPGSDPAYVGFLSFTYDNLNTIQNFSYSKESHRLIALFYYWNIIQYFNANNALMDQPWDTTLYQFIPAMREAKNDTAFHTQFMKLVTHINDSHGFTSSPIIRNFIGAHFPLVGVKSIENQTVVTKLDSTISDLAVGDIIRKIDGVEIQVMVDSLKQYFAASNENTLQRDVHEELLSLGTGPSVEIEYEDAHGNIHTTSLLRDADRVTYYEWLFTDTMPMWKITDCGYGYINMGKLNTALTNLVYNTLKDTPGIIFDIRNYPNGTLWYLIPHLYQSPKTWALLPVPDLTFPGWYNWADNRLDAGTFFNPQPYNGKVIILANAETQSQAEYTVMGLQVHPKAFTIGSQTAGADGNISNIVLPGELRTFWSTLGVFYPDTTDTQRIGIRIDSVVKPTIEDIRNGFDRELYVALDCLSDLEDQVQVENKLTVYPNPVTDLLKISLDRYFSETIHARITNSIGQILFDQQVHPDANNQIGVNVAEWNDGIYFIETIVNSKVVSTSKFIKQ